VPSASNASPVVKTLDLKHICSWDISIPGYRTLVRFLRRFYLVQNVTALVSTTSRNGFGIKCSGFHTVAEIRNYCEIKLGNTVSVHIIIIIIIIIIIHYHLYAGYLQLHVCNQQCS
jgi:hypothetical protein